MIIIPSPYFYFPKDFFSSSLPCLPFQMTQFLSTSFTHTIFQAINFATLVNFSEFSLVSKLQYLEKARYLCIMHFGGGEKFKKDTGQ